MGKNEEITNGIVLRKLTQQVEHDFHMVKERMKEAEDDISIIKSTCGKDYAKEIIKVVDAIGNTNQRIDKIMESQMKIAETVNAVIVTFTEHVEQETKEVTIIREEETAELDVDNNRIIIPSPKETLASVKAEEKADNIYRKMQDEIDKMQGAVKPKKTITKDIAEKMEKAEEKDKAKDKE